MSLRNGHFRKPLAAQIRIAAIRAATSCIANSHRSFVYKPLISRLFHLGDFRTGRAINMRRVIPYIASHFRKDRIWLRRTKPAKREYKIAIAVDDSSSMSDNRSKELAFESLALVSQVKVFYEYVQNKLFSMFTSNK
jgi:midasin (ATPase involved in ribosome maturation)